MGGSTPEKNATILLRVLILILSGLVLRTAWVCDDACIFLRHADLFVKGHGLTCNSGERAQGFTNPLWLLLMTAFYLVTGETYYTSIFLSLASVLAAAWLIAFHQSADVVGAALALSIMVFSKAFIDYSTSGLKNPLSYLLTAAFLYVCFRPEPDRRSLLWLSLLAGLGTLNRMDAILLYAPVLLYRLFQIEDLRALGTVALGLTPFLVWESFSIV